ncbi:hypothetical protein [Streptomyces sp. NPDC005385]
MNRWVTSWARDVNDPGGVRSAALASAEPLRRCLRKVPAVTYDVVHD